MKINYILRVFALVSIAIFFIYSFYKVPKLSYGFTGYYTFSKMLLEGEHLEKAYMDEPFNQKINDYGIHNIYELYNIIPTSGFVYLPVAWLQPINAKIVWGIISILFSFLSLVLLLKIFDIKITENLGLSLITLFFLGHPVYENISMGQIYILLLFLFSLSLYGLKKNNYILTSIPISFSILFKGYGVFLLLWLIIIKKYKAVLISSAVIMVIILVTLPIIHLEPWKAFLGLTGTMLGRYNEDSIVVYQTLNGFMRHLLIYDSNLNPYPITNIPRDYVYVLSILINLSIMIWLFLKTRKYGKDAEPDLLSYCVIMGASVTTAPMAEEYHYVLYLPLVFGLGKYLLYDMSNTLFKTIYSLRGFIKIPNILYILSVLLLLLPINYRALQFSKFPIYLLAYPKLYGGIMLIITYFLSREKSHVQS